MVELLEKFVGSLTYWCGEHGGLKVSVIEDRGDSVELELLDDEGEEFYVGNYADPGLVVRWVGPVAIPGRSGRDASPDLVEVNGVIFEAKARAVAGWVVGLQ